MTTRRLLLKAQDLKQVLQRYLDRLRQYREALNRLNVYPVPDGDTGTNMTLTEADETITAAITGHLAAEHDVVVSVVAGGQPLYAYLFGVE